jgi:GNAT superfamily N-acetyltransferase
VVFKVVFRDEARKAFERLDRAVRQHVRRVIDGLAAWEEPFAGYHAFYGRPHRPRESYDEAWDRFGPDQRIHARGARGQGVARALIGEVERWAREQGCAFPVERQDVLPLWPRLKSLHANLSVYDAQYVALAEALHVPLITTDARVKRSGIARCEVEVFDLHT